jgi:hypothetical protein
LDRVSTETKGITSDYRKDVTPWIKHDSKRKRGRETKEKLFSLVENSEPHGLTLGQFVEATKKVFPPKGLSRDTVSDICREYVRLALFSQVPNHKFGKYHLGPKAYGDPGLAASFLQQKIMKPNTFHNLGKEAICFSSDLCSYQYKALLQSPEHKKYAESPDKDEKYDRLYLFEYSLKLSATIIYQLIQALRYVEATPLLSGTRRDEFILKWIGNAVTPMSIVQTFRRLLPINKRLTKADTIQENESLGWLELEKGKINELENIFVNTFGRQLFKDLEYIRSQTLPHDVNAHKRRISESQRIEQLQKEDNDHIKCAGTWAKPEPNTFIFPSGHKVILDPFNPDGHPIKKCSKCGRQIVMRWMTLRKS